MTTQQAKDQQVYVRIINYTSNPQELCWRAMHQCYSTEPTADAYRNWTEAQYGEALVSKLLKGDRGHFGCLEHGSITFNVCGFPHSVINQARTHRIGCTFDVQSFRYTCPGDSYVEDIEDIVYLRPVGTYTNRKGKTYEYTQEMREQDYRIAEALYAHYTSRIDQGVSEEHARGLMPFELRQHFVVTFNPRSLMHFLDLRHKADAQLEIKWLAEDLFGWFQVWMPQVAGWYGEKRLGKGKLAP